jgi:predicted Zn-dependent protease
MSRVEGSHFVSDSSEIASGIAEVEEAKIDACQQLFDSGDSNGARAKLLDLEAFSPRDEQQWVRLHSICLALNDRTRAQVYTERFLSLHTDNVEAQLANARNFMSTQFNWDRVRESLAAALKHPRTDAKYWHDIAEIQSAIRDHDGVLSSAGKSLTLEPSNADLREKLIYSLGVLKHLKEVRRECRTLATLLDSTKVENPVRWARLARIAVEAGDAKSSKKFIDRAISYKLTDNYEADVELLRALLLTRQSKRAMPHLQSLLVDDSKNVWLWKTLLNTAILVKSHDIAALIVKRMKRLPYQDADFALRLSQVEEMVSRRPGGSFLRSLIGRLWS